MKSLKIGILGGGQLGRMTAMAASKMGHETVIFNDKDGCPASFVTNNCVIAEFNDFEALSEFATRVDVATFEFENIPLATVEFLEKKVQVFPSSKALKITQNRLLEKAFLNGIGVATADFREVKTNRDLLGGLHEFERGVLKTATMGYDGKGQFVLRDEREALNAWDEVLENNLRKNGLVLEKLCPFTSEISVIVSRGTISGNVSRETICYEPLTNIHKNGILDQSFYPARISESCKEKAQEIAIKIAEKIDLVGVLAVEFFVMENDELLVNELAPRPHNSGHFSMDGAHTSQFEQLVRAITGMKLGDASFHSKGFMQNLIGENVKDLTEFEENDKAKIHLYDKKEAKEGRKMGHVNVIE